MRRRAYIDVARGLAVLLMIEAHTTDAWTRAIDKHGVAFRDATILGGFAAPLFLWLAGVASVLAAVRAASRGGSRATGVDVVCRRGLEIFILAFLFRLQAFVVSPGSHPIALFRVDILNVMGPAIAASAVLWGCTASTAGRTTLFAVAAAAIALATPIVRGAAWVEAMPIWIQWYLRPAGEYTTFTLFPWIGFVFAGGAAGSLIAATRDEPGEARLQIVLAAVGAALVALGFATAARPSIYAVSSFWTSSPTWFAIRVGVMMIALAGLKACTTEVSRGEAAAPSVSVTTVAAGSRTPVVQPLRVPRWLQRLVTAAVGGLARLGRSSLFIYWIHVELVYGYASWLWRGRLPLWGTAIAFAAFSALMYGALVLRDRYTTGGLDESPRIRPSPDHRWRRAVRHAGADVG